MMGMRCTLRKATCDASRQGKRHCGLTNCAICTLCDALQGLHRELWVLPLGRDYTRSLPFFFPPLTVAVSRFPQATLLRFARQNATLRPTVAFQHCQVRPLLPVFTIATPTRNERTMLKDLLERHREDAIAAGGEFVGTILFLVLGLGPS